MTCHTTKTESRPKSTRKLKTILGSNANDTFHTKYMGHEDHSKRKIHNIKCLHQKLGRSYVND